MRAIKTCLDCGVRVSRYDAKRCSPCAATERTARRLAEAPPCLDCARPLYDARSTRCRACNNRLARPPRVERSDALVVCPLDGWPVEGHQRCRGCTALTGEEHTQQMDRDGACDACWRHFDRVALGRVAWAEAS